jgi:hypothetical protein
MSFTNNEGADRWELGDAIQIDLDPEEPDHDERSEDPAGVIGTDKEGAEGPGRGNPTNLI